MLNAYVTKRQAPPGYDAVTRVLAEEVYKRGCEVVLCGNKVNHFNVLDAEKRGYRVRASQAHKPFALLVYDYVRAIPNACGRVCVFYVRTQDAQWVLETLQSSA